MSERDRDRSDRDRDNRENRDDRDKRDNRERSDQGRSEREKETGRDRDRGNRSDRDRDNRENRDDRDKSDNRERSDRGRSERDKETERRRTTEDEDHGRGRKRNQEEKERGSSGTIKSNDEEPQNKKSKLVDVKMESNTVVPLTSMPDVSTPDVSGKTSTPDSQKLKLFSAALSKQKAQMEAQKQELIERLARENVKLEVKSEKIEPMVVSSLSDQSEPLLLDELGREIDTYGNLVFGSVIQRHSSSLANKRRNDVAYQQQLVKKRRENPYLSINSANTTNGRKKRDLNSWIQPGKYIEIGEEIRETIKKEEEVEKAWQFEKKLVLDAREIEEKKALDESDAYERSKEEKKALISQQPKDVEWWDKPFLKGRPDVHGEIIYSYGALNDIIPIDFTSIDSKIIHPVPIQPPAEIQPDGPVALPLTKAEQKRITKQNKTAARIRANEEQLLGVREVPQDRVRLTNMYRVYGTDAMLDPTKIELLVRKETNDRLERHDERNQERKLTSEQKKEKKMKKLTKDTDVIVNVCVFKVTEMTTKNKFKVDKNAQQLFLSGTLVITPAFSLVVVEGGTLAVRKYKKVMLNRIKWNGMNLKKEGDSDDDEDEEMSEEDGEGKPSKNARCDLIWEGEVVDRSFHDFQVKASRTEIAAKKYLNDKGCGHYFDMTRTFTPGK
jgi:U4/U6 small nuclear ribonucleoprotein PRP3